MSALPTEQTRLVAKGDDAVGEKQPKMQVTPATWAVAIAGILIMNVILGSFQFIAVLRPYDEWTVDNIYGGTLPKHPTEFFAYHQGWAYADTLFSCPLQLVASIGMLRGTKWGFLLGLAAAVAPFYSALNIFIWDRDTGARQNTLFYWVIVWGMFPALGIAEGGYCFWRLMKH